MFKNSVLKLTLYYILIISILSISVSTLIYFNTVKNSAELFKKEQTRIEKKFGNEDPRYVKKLQFIEDGVEEIQNKVILNLVGLNILIITIVGILAYLFAKKTIAPIEANVRKQKEFISNVSHELKTPLTALKTTFEIDLKTKNADLKETLKSGIEEVDKLNLLINGFLRLSKLDSKKHEIKKEIFSVTDTLNDILKRYEHIINFKKIEINLDLSENIVYTDKFLLIELLSTIFDNAVKFTPKNEEITIRTYKEGKFDYISIADSGVGISEQNTEKIFERFYKEDSSRGENLGIGIGLSIAKEISEIIGCQIVVKRNKVKGSNFILKFSALFQN